MKRRVGNIVPQSAVQVVISERCPLEVVQALWELGFGFRWPKQAGSPKGKHDPIDKCTPAFLGRSKGFEFWRGAEFHLSNQVAYGVFDVGFETWRQTEGGEGRDFWIDQPPNGFPKHVALLKVGRMHINILGDKKKGARFKVLEPLFPSK